MAIAKTKLINITGHIQYLNRALERFVELECFHPVESSQIVGRVHGLTTFSADNPCNMSLAELEEIEKEFDFYIKDVEIKGEKYSMDSVCSFIAAIHIDLRALVEKRKVIQERIREYEDALTQIKNIESLDISFDEIFSTKYVTVRVGRIPTDSIDKLRFYRSRPFIFRSFSEDHHYAWCMYFTTNQYKREVDNIFSSLFFERIFIPEFVHGTPEDAKVALQNEIDKCKHQLTDIQDQIDEVLFNNTDDLEEFKGELRFLSKVNEAKKYVVGLGDKFSINGFVEEQDEDKVQSIYENVEGVDVEVYPPDHDQRLTPPTKLKNGWFSRPFSLFVEMYGLPSNTDLDPTPFVALTYCLLFGIMFGDVGQGLVLAILGFILSKWKGIRLGDIAIRIGISATFFGFLYGSVFGDEHLLDPFYINVLGLEGKPIHTMDSSFTMTLLLAAVAVGATLIISSMSLNMYQNIKHKHYAELFFSHNGVAGLLFYLFVGGGLALQVGMGISIFTPLTIILAVVIPIGLIFMKEPIERKLHGEPVFPDGVGGFITEGFFELFEVILSYITNTMSFMRVGGFVLSHAGMMMVVFSLMEMGGNPIATAIIFVGGNLFVMALEGMIVGIQVLRLEFYEMFSRYYKGDGIAFESFK